MREIIFRAKKLDTNEWIEGWYLESCFGQWPLLPAIVPHIDAREGHYRAVEINRNTLGQFTDIVDKCGQRIFEGDIIKADNGHIGYVAYEYGMFIKRCKCHPNSFGSTFLGDNETVIGNIYDDSNLIWRL